MTIFLLAALFSTSNLFLHSADSIRRADSTHSPSHEAPCWKHSPLNLPSAGNAVLVEGSGIYLLADGIIFFRDRISEEWVIKGTIAVESIAERHLVGVLQCDSIYLAFAHSAEEWHCLNISKLSDTEPLTLSPCPDVNCTRKPSIGEIFWNRRTKHHRMEVTKIFSADSIVVDLFRQPTDSSLSTRIFHVTSKGRCSGLHFPSWRIKNTISTDHGRITDNHPPQSISIALAEDYTTGVDFAANFIGDLTTNEGDSLYTMFFFDGTVYGAVKANNVIYAIIENMGLVSFSTE